MFLFNFATSFFLLFIIHYSTLNNVPYNVKERTEEANCLAKCGYMEDTFSDKGGDTLAGFENRAIGPENPLHASPYALLVMITIKCEGADQQEVNFKCTGSILAEQYVLTAAHCLFVLTADLPEKCLAATSPSVEPIKYLKVMASAVRVYTGQNSKKMGTDDVYEVEQWQQFPAFNPDDLGIKKPIKDDMAILKLKPGKLFKLGATDLRKICLPTYLPTNEIATGRLLLMSGWGKNLDSSMRPIDSEVLRETILSVDDGQFCQDHFNGYFHWQKTHFCASRRARGGLEGDSGAAATTFSPVNRRLYLFGTFSQSMTDSELKNNRPDVFVAWRAEHCKFVKDYTDGKAYCIEFYQAEDQVCKTILQRRRNRLYGELCGTSDCLLGKMAAEKKAADNAQEINENSGEIDEIDHHGKICENDCPNGFICVRLRCRRKCNGLVKCQSGKCNGMYCEHEDGSF